MTFMGIHLVVWLLVGVFFFALGRRELAAHQRKRLRRALVREMDRRGLARLDPQSDDWRAVVALAYPGAERGRREIRAEHDGGAAFALLTQKDFEAECFRFPDEPRRMIGLSEWTEEFELQGAWERPGKRSWTCLCLWAGELRELSPPGRVLAWSSLPDRFGTALLKAAEARGITLGVAGSRLAGDPLSRAARAALERSLSGGSLQASLYLGRGLWVLESPATRAPHLLDELLALVRIVSGALDRHPSGPPTDEPAAWRGAPGSTGEDPSS